MPWCATCDRFLSPSTVNADGTCRKCGKRVEAVVGGSGSTRRSRSTSKVDRDDGERPPLPWHLWALVGALVIYLGFRFWQGIEALWNWAL